MSFIAAGLGIAGLTEAALTVAAGEAIGAGIGALTNPKDRLKGALIGGATGAVGGGIGAGIGALGGAASGAADAAAVGTTDAVSQATAQAASNIPGQTLSQIGADIGISPAAAVGAPTSVSAPVAGLGSAPAIAPVAAPVAQSSLLSNAGTALTKAAGPKILETGASLVGGGQPTYDKSGQQKLGAANVQGQSWANEAYKPYGKAKGGAIHLRDGDFIIPADVVSAIGNGSTKAGAEYLDHLFQALRAGPKPKAGSLAKRRAKERHVA